MRGLLGNVASHLAHKTLVRLSSILNGLCAVLAAVKGDAFLPLARLSSEGTQAGVTPLSSTRSHVAGNNLIYTGSSRECGPTSHPHNPSSASPYFKRPLIRACRSAGGVRRFACRPD